MHHEANTKVSPMITLDSVVFANPVHRTAWYMIRIEKSVHVACRDATKVTVDDHRIWWEESAISTTRKLYFIHAEHQTVGVLRVDHRGTWTEVWLAIKPDARRKGFATQALRLLSEQASMKQWPPLSAVVNGAKNLPSWRLFTRAGFVLKKDGFAQLIQPGRGI